MLSSGSVQGKGNRIISIIDWQAEDVHISYEKPKQINQDSCLHSHIDKCDEFHDIAIQYKDHGTNGSHTHFIVIRFFLYQIQNENKY